MPTSYSYLPDILRELEELRRLSASNRLKCDCTARVPLYDERGRTMVCPEDCPAGQLDLHIATALAFVELESERS